MMKPAPARRTLAVAIGLAAMLGSCHHKERLPEGIMDTAQMVDFLTEEYLLEGYFAIVENQTTDSASGELLAAYDNLLRRNGVSRETVDSSIAYYARRPKEYSAISEAALHRLEAMSNQPATTDVEPPAIEIKIKHN